MESENKEENKNLNENNVKEEKSQNTTEKVDNNEEKEVKSSFFQSWGSCIIIKIVIISIIIYIN